MPDANVRRARDIDSYDFLNFLIGLNNKLAVEVPESDYGEAISNRLPRRLRYSAR